MAEDSTMAGRTRRYARVGAAVGGLAARFAGERYLGMRYDRLDQAHDLREALGGLKGPIMKVAQILATIPNALPREWTEQLAQLQANAPPMGWAFVRRRMAAELGPGWETKFAEFGHEAAAAASLGQVHRATDHDGRSLACKLQYPNMKSVVEADLRQLGLIFAVYRRYDRAINPTEIHKELSARLHEELDYRREARHMRLYTLMLKNEPNVHVPEVIHELCGDRLLTMAWLEGTPLLPYIEAHPSIEDRNQVAFNMFRTWYVPLYYYGVIHGDPHLGNYTVRPDRSINLLDFGCIRAFRPQFVRGVIDLYKALRDGDQALAVHAYETWGFKNLSNDLIEILGLWAQYLYGPLLEDRTRLIDEHEGREGAEIAMKVRRALDAAGGVTPPPEFLLMDRAAIGLGSVFTHLKAEINWHRLFHDLIDDFDEAMLAKRQADAFASVGLTPAH